MKLLLLLILLGCLIMLYVTPDWLRSASIVELNSWYPRFGNIIYAFFNYLVYIFLFASFLGLAVLYRKRFSSFVSRKRMQLFYILFFLLLIGQYYYCKNHSEFYPAVMMPLFDEGHYEKEVKDIRVELVVTDGNDRRYKIRPEELLGDFAGSKSQKHTISKKFLKFSSTDKSSLHWLKLKLIQKLKIKGVKSVSFYKIEQTYLYDEKLQLQGEKTFLVQTIHLK